MSSALPRLLRPSLYTSFAIVRASPPGVREHQPWDEPSRQVRRTYLPFSRRMNMVPHSDPWGLCFARTLTPWFWALP